MDDVHDGLDAHRGKRPKATRLLGWLLHRCAGVVEDFIIVVGVVNMKLVRRDPNDGPWAICSVFLFFFFFFFSFLRASGSIIDLRTVFSV